MVRSGRHCPASIVPQPQIKIQSFLANLPLFRELGSEDIDRISTGARTVHAARGETLFRKGDPSDGFYTVVYGQIKLAFHSANGAEKVVDLLGPNQTFGEAVMFMERPYPVYAQALADSLLVHVSKGVVFEEIERDPAFARKMIGGLARRLHGLVSDLEAYTLHSGTQRVLGYLLRGVPENESGEQAVEISLPTSKSVLASRLNLTPEHFSRILHDLTELGLIRVEGRSVRILDTEALRRHEG